jgi:hypothetical protein
MLIPISDRESRIYVRAADFARDAKYLGQPTLGWRRFDADVSFENFCPAIHCAVVSEVSDACPQLAAHKRRWRNSTDVPADFKADVGLGFVAGGEGARQRREDTAKLAPN